MLDPILGETFSSQRYVESKCNLVGHFHRFRAWLTELPDISASTDGFFDLRVDSRPPHIHPSQKLHLRHSGVSLYNTTALPGLGMTSLYPHRIYLL